MACNHIALMKNKNQQFTRINIKMAYKKHFIGWVKFPKNDIHKLVSGGRVEDVGLDVVNLRVLAYQVPHASR